MIFATIVVTILPALICYLQQQPTRILPQPRYLSALFHWLNLFISVDHQRVVSPLCPRLPLHLLRRFRTIWFHNFIYAHSQPLPMSLPTLPFVPQVCFDDKELLSETGKNIYFWSTLLLHLFVSSEKRSVLIGVCSAAHLRLQSQRKSTFILLCFAFNFYFRHCHYFCADIAIGVCRHRVSLCQFFCKRIKYLMHNPSLYEYKSLCLFSLGLFLLCIS